MSQLQVWRIFIVAFSFLALEMRRLWSGICLEVTVQDVVSKWGRKVHDVKHSSCVSLCLYSCQDWVSCIIKHQCCCLSHSRISPLRERTHARYRSHMCLSACHREHIRQLHTQQMINDAVFEEEETLTEFISFNWNYIKLWIVGIKLYVRVYG